MIVKAFGVAAAFGLFAGPVAATIVNISGTQNGEQSWDYAQVGALISPVQLTFQPGTTRSSTPTIPRPATRRVPIALEGDSHK
ncbi:MAG: hypothetical protein ACRYG4_12060 [Janthinobacterium lividum]